MEWNVNISTLYLQMVLLDMDRDRNDSEVKLSIEIKFVKNIYFEKEYVKIYLSKILMILWKSFKNTLIYENSKP